MNGVDPVLLSLGTKSGSRQTFAAAKVPHPAGFEDLNTEEEIVQALCKLAEQRPDIQRAVVKINEGFSGEGNGVFNYPEAKTDPQEVDRPCHNWSGLQKAEASSLSCESSNRWAVSLKK